MRMLVVDDDAGCWCMITGDDDGLSWLVVYGYGWLRCSVMLMYELMGDGW